MTEAQSSERLEIAVNTPTGPVTVPVEVPVGLVPVTAIVRSMRHLGEAAQALEERQAHAQGQAVSCRKGCAACCRMLVPVSVPEAFSLAESIKTWPAEKRGATMERVEEARERLKQADLLPALSEVSESERQFDDQAFEPINRAYYALRMPCPFLVDEVCSIYEDRPAACRELLVTSPAELCQDLQENPIRPIPVPLRIGTVLAMLWAELVGGPVRFIPLPLALDWVERHASDRDRSWRGAHLLERALDKVWWYLNRELANRRATASGSTSNKPLP